MNKKVLKRFLPLVLIVLLIGVAWTSGLMDMVNLEAVKAQRGYLLDMVSAHPVLSVAGFTALYAAAVALSLPIATLLTLLGGFLFGRWLGTAAIVIGATAGATILFLIARSAVGDSLREKAGPLYNKIAANMEKNATSYMLFMRLVPLFPFFLVNIVPALFNVRLLPYALTTFFGIIPGTFVYANVGRELGTIESLSDLASPQTLIAFTLLGLFALIPTIYKQIKGRKKVAAALLGVMLATAHPAQAGENYDRFLSLYDGLLQAYVRPAEKDGIAYNGVDYDGWAADSRHREALKLLLVGNPGSYAGDEKTAFWINAYNFLTIELIVREGERKSIKNLGGTFTSPWTRHAWPLAGMDYTLDHIEHKILRPIGDARIHFAINCASVSCPDLRRESYKAGTLDQQLDEQVKTAMANTGKVMRKDGDTLYVSKIFDWFADDFKRGDVKGWLGDYAGIDPNASLRFMDYDWSLNKVN
ncbi:MAG TPA: hypothetical protein DEA55_00270 [Rhodospirillaceae bacterium]|nr:hypothetical protein [Rhodospirillaceae bacterium]